MQAVLSKSTPPPSQNPRLRRDSFAAQEWVPFQSVEEAWFWFICSVEAREQGAIPGRSRGGIPRPFEPIDIYRVLERLYRNRHLRLAHIKVLNDFGRRHVAPEPFQKYEKKAHRLWQEAMKELEDALQRRGIVGNIFKPTEAV